MFRNDDKERKRNIVFYGRVSTEQEAQLSALQNQMQWYDEQLKFHTNWTCVNKYIDEGITGTQAKKRPAFLQMINDANNGEFDLIVTREVSRFARNTAETLIYTRKLKNECGVEVFFIEDNIWTMDGDGELRLSLMATLAQEESRKTSERVKAGIKIARDNSVLFGNGNILGYDRIGNTYIINEEQAETVRLIYNLYNQGMSSYKIRDELERLGRKTSLGKTNWRASIILNILKNPIYKGIMRYGVYYTDDYLNQKQYKNYDESTYQYKDGNFESIIPSEIWDNVQEILKSRTRTSINGRRMIGVKKTKDIWMKKIECKCGSKFNKNKWRTNKKTGLGIYGYQCLQQKSFGSYEYRKKNGLPLEGCCDVPMIADWKLDFMAKEIIKCIWTDRKNDVLAAYEMLLIDDEYESNNNTKQIDEINLQINNQKLKLEKLINLRLDGEITKEELSNMRVKIDKKINELELELEKYNSNKNKNDNNKKKYLEELKKSLEESIDFSQPKLSDTIIDFFVAKVIPLGDNKFKWYIKLDNDEGKLNEILLEIQGRKNQNPKVVIENEDVLNSLSSNHSNRSDNISKVGYYLFSLILDFDMAKTWRKQQTKSNIIRKNQYDDIEVEVFLLA